ncbi:MAG: SDR family NAD(P)-dependent oxidoreductase [Clostridia bacterium]|nr:SDR family NAD(P)-dependent oxidoreductase [Clostridia bacterium]
MKYVLVTGACGGMGKAVCERLKNNGYTVFALDRKSIEAQENIIPVICDITDENAVISAFEQVKSQTDELYAILHFSGIYTLNSLLEIGEEEFVRTFDVNLFGVYRINKIFLPLLKSGSRIVITTSELAPLSPLPFTGLYAVSKSALDKYAYSLRMEVQLLGISVSVLRPGAVKTDMLPVSTKALDNFCENTTLYSCNAKRFRKIVDSVEARNITPDKIADKTAKILGSKKPKQVYKINRNPLLLMLNILPKRLATFIIKKILE